MANNLETPDNNQLITQCRFGLQADRGVTNAIRLILGFRIRVVEGSRILDFELVRARPPDVKHFGDAEAVFRVGTLLLRLVRDRGQEFMDLATIAAPDKFYQFDDVEIAMGWKTIDEVLAKRELEPLTESMHHSGGFCMRRVRHATAIRPRIGLTELAVRHVEG